MKKFAYVLGIAVLAAVLFSLASQPMAMEERLIRIQAAEALPGYAGQLEREPLEVQAVLLDYRHDDLLRLKAEAALVEFPALAREILSLYGAEPEFQDILRQHGSAILPPIHYFLNHDVHTLALREAAAHQWRSVKVAAQRWWQDKASDNGTPRSAMGAVDASPTLTPEQRGWYAVNLIRREGHGVLGQFTVGTEGMVKWIQSERLLEAVNSLFAGGIRQLETRVQSGQAVRASDIGWGLADGAVMVSAVKLLRVGRSGIVSTRSAGIAGRSAALSGRFSTASGLISVGRYAKWPVAVAGAYLVVRHPALVNDTLAAVARTLGYPTWLVLLLGWTLILLPCLYLGSWLLRLVVGPSLSLLCWSVNALSWLERKSRHGGERYLFR
ncbi:hypothetical protein [Litchfieldella rifensis]|uniref:CHASE2 domain-containing protein n=1 Tax=Litchfieldella rifensis TaxID=762643 RepID=A0ABV7LVL4_9GAMM